MVNGFYDRSFAATVISCSYSSFNPISLTIKFIIAENPFRNTIFTFDIGINKQFLDYVALIVKLERLP